VIKHRTINIFAAVLLAVAIALAMSTSHLIDDPTDHQAEWAESTALADAQKVARLEARTERAAAQLCVKVKGPNAAHAWTEDGQLVCRDALTPPRFTP
jgi:hypothetical protein